MKKITLEEQEDGNWKGTTTKFDKEITVRDVGPDIVLQRLITHE